MSKDRQAKEAEMIKKEWFPQHVAEYSVISQGKDSIEQLLWQKPGTGIYYVVYLYRRGTLIVYGDVGEAIFRWAPDIGSMKDLAGLSLEYFASKCRASEYGFPYVMWNQRKAELNAAHHVSQLDKKHIALWKEYDGRQALGFKGEWHQWLGEYGHDVFGDICEMGDLGDVIHPRCHSYLVGLKMAFKQIEETRKCRTKTEFRKLKNGSMMIIAQ